MLQLHRLARLIFICLFLFTSIGVVVGQTPAKAILLTVDGAIGPAVADYIQRGIKSAEQQNAPLVIIKMDTPGGLDKSMREINKAILAATVPIVTYVAPSGARAASAGTYILYASHVAAMAPGTNLGAASPVNIGGGGDLTPPKQDNDKTKQQSKTNSETEKSSTMGRKVFNDAVAYIRSLAQLRGRNAQWAEQAVLEAKTLTAEEAKQQKVIEIVAGNITDLLTQLNGRSIDIQGKKLFLDTKTVTVQQLDPDWRTKFLAVVTDPSVAYILLLIGIYGLFFEFANPGFVVPGVAGAIALILALYAFQLLPINYAGLGLIFLGIIFMVAEAFMPSFGAVGIGGVIAFIFGSILLFDRSLAGYQIAWPLILGMALANVGFFILVIGMAVKARRQKVVTGRENLIGKTGVITVAISAGELGYARILGERWQVKSTSNLRPGDKIRVINIKRLTLHVEPIPQGDKSWE